MAAFGKITDHERRRIKSLVQGWTHGLVWGRSIHGAFYRGFELGQEDTDGLRDFVMRSLRDGRNWDDEARRDCARAILKAANDIGVYPKPIPVRIGGDLSA